MSALFPAGNLLMAEDLVCHRGSLCQTSPRLYPRVRRPSDWKHPRGLGGGVHYCWTNIKTKNISEVLIPKQWISQIRSWFLDGAAGVFWKPNMNVVPKRTWLSFFRKDAKGDILQNVCAVLSIWGITINTIKCLKKVVHICLCTIFQWRLKSHYIIVII